MRQQHCSINAVQQYCCADLEEGSQQQEQQQRVQQLEAEQSAALTREQGQQAVIAKLRSRWSLCTYLLASLYVGCQQLCM